MFSDREQKVIKILGKKTMSFMNIAVILFKDDMPMDANIMVSNTVNRINRKCKHHNLPWTLLKRSEARTLLITKEVEC